MLEMLQDHSSETEETFLFEREDRISFDLWGCTGGDIEILRMSIYRPSWAALKNTHSVSQMTESVDRWNHTARGFIAARRNNTRSVEVYKCLSSFSSGADKSSSDIGFHAHWGNLEIIRHLLDSRVDIRGDCGRHENPLIAASRKCHKDIVDLLLKRGGDLNF